MARYWDNVCRLQQIQTAKGIKAYGQTLEENKKLNADERITMLEEELVDSLMYCESLKEMIKPRLTIVVDKLPETCFNCKFCYDAGDKFGIICVADNETRRTNFSERPSWCPIKLLNVLENI